MLIVVKYVPLFKKIELTVECLLFEIQILKKWGRIWGVQSISSEVVGFGKKWLTFSLVIESQGPLAHPETGTQFIEKM